MTASKYNPFRPNGVITPGMFVGRIDEIDLIERCLFQTKNGNPQHFLIQGERGIGKSSLLFYIESVASGTIPALNNNSYRFLTISIDLGSCQTQTDIIRKLGRGIRSEVSKRDALRKSAAAFWDWITNWEVLGVKYNKDTIDLDVEEVCEDLVFRLAELCSSATADMDGVLILIDEADRPSSGAGLGELLKMITERLARQQCQKVVFGLAGLPSVMWRLRESHESSPRLFHTMLLEPLQISERKSVLRLGIEDANRKNSIKTTMDNHASDFLAELSEGYPHFVQQFAYSAFEHDSDDLIDEEDVGTSAFKEGGALSQLGDKFFNEMYHARISSEDYRRVLDAMAEHGDKWVSRKDIIGQSGVSDTNVTNALQALKAKQIIIQDDTRRGFYRLPTNSFAAWINAIRAARAKSDAQTATGFNGGRR